MVKCFLITIFLLNSFFGFSQDQVSIKSDYVLIKDIENAPIYPECEKLDKNLQKLCLQNQIQKFIVHNFDTNLANTLGLEPGKKRLYVTFLIASDGLIKKVKARGPHKLIEDEGIRVISNLPKMTPGLQKGKPINVKYTIPITFMVEK